MSLVPYVIEQSSRGERSFDIYSRLLEDRIVMLNEEVNSASASVVVAQLLYLESKDPTKDISLYYQQSRRQRNRCLKVGEFYCTVRECTPYPSRLRPPAAPYLQPYPYRLWKHHT